MPAKKTVTIELQPSQMVEGLDSLVGEMVERKFSEFIKRTERTQVMATAPSDCKPQELSDRPGFWFDPDATQNFEMPFRNYDEYKIELCLTRLGTWIEHGTVNPVASKPTSKEYWIEIPRDDALARIKTEFDIEPGELDRFGSLREV